MVKPPPKKRRTAIGGFELAGLPPSDPTVPPTTLLDEYPEEWHDILQLFYHDFRTRYRRVDDIKTVYVFRAGVVGTDEDELYDWLRTIYNYQKYAFKIQISITILLYNIKTGEYHIKVGNEIFLNLFPEPMTISNKSTLKKMHGKVRNADALQVGAMGAPDTASRILAILSHNVVCYKIGDTFPLLGGASGHLPDWVKHSRSVRCLPAGSRGGDCLFVLLAAHFSGGKVRGIKRLSKSLKQRWCIAEKIDIHKFDGKIPYSRLGDVENVFKVAISLYRARNKKNQIVPLRLSTAANYRSKVLAIVSDRREHVAGIITNLERLARFYRCKCGHVCNSKPNMRKHKSACGLKTKITRHGGNFLGQNRNLFDLLALEGVKMESNAKFNPYFSVFDCETYQRPKNDKISVKKEYETELKVLCLAVNSNLPNSQLGYYSLENCADAYEMVYKMIRKLNDFADRAENLMKEKLKDIFDQIDEKIRYFSKKGQKNRDPELVDYLIWQTNEWTKYRTNLEEHCGLFSVYAYNAHFDVSLLKEEIVRISQELGMKFGKIIKTSGKTLVFTVGKLKFRDAMRLTSGGDLRSFLRCYGESDQQKQFFPHTWMVHPRLLQLKRLPEIEKWLDNLSGNSISQEDYKQMQLMWKKLDCRNMGDFLRFYCCSDVDPLIGALENQSKMWAKFQICQQSDGLSLPSLAMKAVMNEIKGTLGVLLWMPSSYGDDVKIEDCLTNNIQGGISQVILRRAEIGQNIEGTNFIPRSLIGLDFNGLYAFELSKPQYNGIPRMWSKRPGSILYAPRRLMSKGSSMEELRYCLFLQWWLDERYGRGHYELEHQYNYKQFWFKGRKFQLDACIRKENRGFLYQGCRFHPHANCSRVLWNVDDIEKETKRLADEKSFFQKIGWKITVTFACEFERKVLPQFPKFENDVMKKYVNLPLRHKMTDTAILHHIKRGTFFGFLTDVTVYVPEKLWADYDAFPPIVRHEDLTDSKLCPAMQHWYAKMKCKFGKRRTLLTGFYGEGLTLSSDLVRFYLQRGFVIKCFDKAVQFAPVAAFKDFVDMIGKKRAQADENPNMTAMSNLYKLIGNSIYGKAIENPKKWNDIVMVDKEKLVKLIRKRTFKTYSNCGPLYEVVSGKTRLTMSSPRLIGYKILNTSKLSLLRLWYDFILHCCGSDRVWSILSDTDSSYFALTGESLEDTVLDARKSDFDRLKEEYLAGELTKRTLGKAKVEWRGNKLIALAPKSNFGVGDDPATTKYTLKGIRKNLNPMTYDHFAMILETQGQAYGVNKGLQLTAEGWRGYKLTKRSLSYAYSKRALIGETGVRTRCLDYYNDTRAKICETFCRFD